MHDTMTILAILRQEREDLQATVDMLSATYDAQRVEIAALQEDNDTLRGIIGRMHAIDAEIAEREGRE